MPDQPNVTQRTRDLYKQLPPYQRDADPALGFPLLRYVSLLGDQVEPVRAFFADPARFIDPATAPYSMLPWLAMIAGVDYRLYPDTDGMRTALRVAVGNAFAGGGKYPGSEGTILGAVTPPLSGTRLARISVKDVPGFRYVISVYRRQVVDRAKLAQLVVDTAPAGLNAQLQVIEGESWDDQRHRGLSYDQLRRYTNDQSRTAVPGSPIDA